MHPGPALPRITDAIAAAALFAELRGAPVEQAAVALLDPEWRLLGTIAFSGEQRSVAPSLRAIVRAALLHDAAALILAHNHPSGCAEPSSADLAFTRALVRIAAPLELALVDHLILTPDATTSFRAIGLL